MQPATGRSKAKLEMEVAEARQTIATLKADLQRLRKRLEMCEGDLDRSEREADQLRRDREDAVQDRSTLQRRAANLELQVHTDTHMHINMHTCLHISLLSMFTIAHSPPPSLPLYSQHSLLHSFLLFVLFYSIIYY